MINKLINAFVNDEQKKILKSKYISLGEKLLIKTVCSCSVLAKHLIELKGLNVNKTFPSPQPELSRLIEDKLKNEKHFRFAEPKPDWIRDPSKHPINKLRNKKLTPEPIPVAVTDESIISKLENVLKDFDALQVSEPKLEKIPALPFIAIKKKAPLKVKRVKKGSFRRVTP